MKLSCQPSPIQSHYYRTPEFFANNENFLGSQFAREEHNASFDFDKVWAGRCPPISSITLLASCKDVVYQRYHAAKVGINSFRAKESRHFLHFKPQKSPNKCNICTLRNIHTKTFAENPTNPPHVLPRRDYAARRGTA